MFEWDEEEKRWKALHHPFTSPIEGHENFLTTDPEKALSRAYDMVLNGVEIGGGSVRIHRQEIQAKVFQALGITESEAQEKFGFLLNALQYGAPPHGGIAFGLDRIVAMMTGTDSIRDVISFPKNNSGRDVMIDSPSTIADEQLEELKISMTV